MGGSDNDQDAGLADLQAAKSVEDRDVADLEFCEGFVGKGKDRQKWLSEPQKFAVPAAKPQNQAYDGTMNR